MTAEAVADEVAAVINVAVLGHPTCAYCCRGAAARCSQLLEGCRAARVALGARLYAAVHGGLSYICPGIAARVAPAPPAAEQHGATAAAVAAPKQEASTGSGSTPRVWTPRPPPAWFFAGGAARRFFLLGVVQKLSPSGWPVNALVARRFGLDRPLLAAA